MLAILAFLLGLVSGLLLFFELFHLPREITLDWFGEVAVKIIFALIIIVAAVLIYSYRYVEGGIVSLVMAIIILILWRDVVPGLLALMAGLLGIFAKEI